MIAVRIIRRAAWEKRLRALGCRRVAKRKRLETRELWRTKDKLYFTVPIDNSEGVLREDDFRTVLAQVKRLEDGPHEY